jgi:TnpA family transposase
MPARLSLTKAQRDALLLLPDTEEAFVRHYSLFVEDIEIISGYRTPETRLAFALQLCVLRYPGRVLRHGEVMPMHLLAFIADQVGGRQMRSADSPAGRKPDTSISPHCESASASRIWPMPARPN